MGDPQFLRTITVLPVSDIVSSAAWYQQALGFETVYLHEGDHKDEPTNCAVLRRGGLTVDLILDEPPPYEEAWTKSGTGYLYLIVRNVDEVFAEVQSRGIAITRGLQIENWGDKGFNLTDPSGNAIHIEQEKLVPNHRNSWKKV